MVISEMIAHLEKLKAEHGDVLCYFFDTCCCTVRKEITNNQVIFNGAFNGSRDGIDQYDTNYGINIGLPY